MQLLITMYITQYMIKQNQNHEQLYRPFPSQNPECKAYDTLSLDSKCICPPCRTRPDKTQQQIQLDRDLQLLRQRKSKNKISDLIIFLNQINKNSENSLLNLPILDTIVFNSDGSVKYIVNYQGGKFKIGKLSTSLKNYMNERKYAFDLQYQKKKFQRQHMGFSFTQLDHQSQKYIKQFQNNIKFMNPQLNRVSIMKSKQKQQEQILTQNQMNSIFSKITRKLYDFTNMQYMQVFPVMYGHEQSSYIKKVKYFREKEINKKNFKIAEHYVGNWYSKNQTLENMEEQFLIKLKQNQDEYLMYITYKLFIYFQKVSNKMVECALLSFITNDEGNSFYIKNVQCFNLFNLHQVQDRVHELPKKLDNYSPEYHVELKQQMKNNFDIFQRNYQRLERQRKEIQEKRQKDIDFSNQVYSGLGKEVLKQYQSYSFIKSIEQQYSRENKNKLKLHSNDKSNQFT